MPRDGRTAAPEATRATITHMVISSDGTPERSTGTARNTPSLTGFPPCPAGAVLAAKGS